MFQKVSWAFATLIFAMLMSTRSMADVCSPEKVGAAVDQAGAALRAYNSEAQPKLKERIKNLVDKKGWTQQGAEEQAIDYLADGKTNELDTAANDLLSRIDTLGRPNSDGLLSCGNIPEISATSSELLAVMKTKTAYLNNKLDKELGTGAPADKSSTEPPKTAIANKPKQIDQKAEPANVVAKEPAPVRSENKPEPDKPAKTVGSWQSTAIESPLPPEEPAVTGPGVPQGSIEVIQEGYTIDEIREVSRGFFGTISTELASVIEYAFSNSGRPSGYVLGSEGGGAILAGLRYGKGTLYMRQGGSMPVYWHGPSIGSDFGADGGRTLFLVYKLDRPENVFRRFTGIDGSAYFVGGVGMKLLKGGKVIMAPIRSGIGLRLGASIGYLRFTDRPTWNPF